MDLSFLSDRYGIKVIKRSAADVYPELRTTKQKIKAKIFDFAQSIIKTGQKINQAKIAAFLNISQQGLSKHLKEIWGSWAELKKILQLTLLETNRPGCKNSDGHKPIEPNLALSIVLDGLIHRNLDPIVEFIQDLAPNDRRAIFGYLTTTLQFT
ncbi:MAG: hypothetical protein HC796_09355 [Synechococcaceae cyanobacterium RL_1_2]|nr:hypothetical protein [Synechococcaceae cyanobacterium RL_1_2]